MPLTLNTRPPQQNVRVTTDLDRATADRVGTVIARMQCTRAESIRADFVALLADAIDTAAINGSGSSNQPTGILNTSGIGSVAGGTNGLAPTHDHLLDLKKEVAVDNADVASCGYLTNTKVEAVLAKAKDSQSQYLLSPYGAELGRSQIAGRRFEVSNNVPSNLT